MVIAKRNYGIDFLRIISMFFIIVLHSLGLGGLLSSVKVGSSAYTLCWSLEIISFCAVNIFALITGYVSYSDNKKDYNFSNYIKLWFEVVFYGLLIVFIFNLINPSLVSTKDYIKSLFPVSFHLYWYFTAYSALFLFIPLLNEAIRNMDNKFLIKCFILLVFVFSIFENVFKVFKLHNGYSCIWLIILYILGSIIKKCNLFKKLKNKYLIITMVVLHLITILFKLYGFSIFKINKDFFINYISITILLISIIYLLLFSRMKFNNKFEKIISFISPCAFSIYIINCHRFIWNYVMNNIFVNIYDIPTYRIFLHVIIFSLIFIIISIILDRIRIWLFDKCKINKLSDKISNMITLILNKLFGLIS